MATKNEQRVSQLMSTFGPGAMLDLPTRSVIVGGLDKWEMRDGTWKSISEPRLAAALERSLRKNNRWPVDRAIAFRTPPLDPGDRGVIPAGVQCAVFPTWFVSSELEAPASGAGAARRRRLINWINLRAEGGRRNFETDDRKKVDVTPIRFVCGCRKGHIQDIDWRYAVHEGIACHEPMWLEERGTSADPADTAIVCQCGKRLSMEQAFIPARLGRCRGERPWLSTNDEGCDEQLKFLTRTATNTYFPQVATAISLPTGEDALTDIVRRHMPDLAAAESVADVSAARKFNAKLKEALKSYADDDVFNRLSQIREGKSADFSGPLKIAEFDVFASGRAAIGENTSGSNLYAETLPRASWLSAEHKARLDALQSVVVVHRLREVVCLYGFTRFEPAAAEAESDLEDIRFSVDGAPIAEDADWLPAAEQFGEGLFLHFDASVIEAWVHSPGAAKRAKDLKAAHDGWASKKQGAAQEFPGAAYVMLHSLSHALMAEIALDCGYPASSLKERIYAIRANGQQTGRFGLLLYTATPGAQGTLGGLVGAAPRLSAILTSALDRLELCSNDPVCADHEMSARDDDSALHGAACHSCLFAPEPSCESRNQFLDRALLVATMRGEGAECFPNA